MYKASVTFDVVKNTTTNHTTQIMNTVHH